MGQFAEAELTPPTGPFQNLDFKLSRQPFSRLLYNEIDSGRWRRVFCVGPTQTGKTLLTFVIPIIYHLFEVGETIVVGIPDMNMAADKWHEDIKPVIESSRYSEFLPITGSGSRGGKVTAVRFRNGATLRFMSGGGSDKKRSAFTARVLAITEVDGLDETGGTSRESDKVSQLQGRTKAFDDRAMVYGECTASIKTGRIWQEYLNGTMSRIVSPCPHCGKWISPEREHFMGWQDAPDQITAGLNAAFHCYECGAAINDEQRIAANHKAKLVHKGQEITPEGLITGKPPQTITLGFRWSAYNNLLIKSKTIGEQEWAAKQAVDQQNADTEMRQQVWAIPAEPAIGTVTLEAAQIMKRVVNVPRGTVPENALQLTIGIDLGKRYLHWILVGWLPQASPHIVDFAAHEVMSDQLGEAVALAIALNEIKELVGKGWGGRIPDRVGIDSGWLPQVPYEFCISAGPRYFPTKGFGAGQLHGKYRHPRNKTETVKYVGEEYFATQQRVVTPSGIGHTWLFNINADAWKSFTQQRCLTPFSKAGSLSIFGQHPNGEVLLPNDKDIREIAMHLTSERRVEEVPPRFERIGSRRNHLLDAFSIASVMGHLSGARLGDVTAAVEASDNEPPPAEFLTPDGRPYHVQDRI